MTKTLIASVGFVAAVALCFPAQSGRAPERRCQQSPALRELEFPGWSAWTSFGGRYLVAPSRR